MNGLASSKTRNEANRACPVCYSHSRFFLTVEQKHYWRCDRCYATFLEPSQRPDAQTEKAHYDLHQNSIDDDGYRAFLNRLAEPLIERLSSQRPQLTTGLDYGCGPGPVLAELLREAGHPMAAWDPIYAPDASVFDTQYDFITCSEVLEHLFEPAASFAHMIKLLKPGGWLGIMTTLQTDDKRFANWHYRRDPTHVVFYRLETLRWLAHRHNCRIEFPTANVALLQRAQ